jgi:hypothetical protein
MKSGKTLSALAAEIERQADAKRDYIADTRKIEMTADGRSLVLGGAHADPYTIGNHAAGQLAGKLDVPVAFFKRMQEKHPDLLAHTVNQLMQRAC